MPDKQLQMATYAAGASLAAITLVYVFAPTFFIDGEAESSASSRKRGIVGLHNQANDCFINSTVQALAGLGDLRLYLIRETHRRALDGPAVYKNLVEDPTRKNLAPWKLEGLQAGLVTQGLKELLDTLNERPIYRKTASVQPFVRCIENAFKQRISRQQQDAQEFLQIVAERLCDEYHAGRRARKRAAELGTIIVDDEILQKRLTSLTVEAAEEEASGAETLDSGKQPGTEKSDINSVETTKTNSPAIKAVVVPSTGEGEPEEESFPLEGGYESQIECLTCGFKPKPNVSTFCTLTLNVPEQPSTTLSSCFDGIFKVEYIDDFKCEKCRLIHAVETLQKDLQKCKDEKLASEITEMIARINDAIATDPENPPFDLTLPDSKLAPKRKIKRHIRITSFPKVLAVHLSRSIFEARASTKNAAKVSFPETLPLGSLISRRNYKLLALVTHKGSHSSGHYETFRRQTVAVPFANQHPFDPSGVYSRTSTPATSTPQLRATPNRPLTPEVPSPVLPAHLNSDRVSLTDSNSAPTTDQLTTASAETLGSSEPSSGSSAPSPRGREKDGETSSLRSATRASLSKFSKNISSSLSRPGTRDGTPAGGKENEGREKVGRMQARRQRKAAERWWRISDDRVKESKTSEVLGMQKEVYLLFYEMIR